MTQTGNVASEPPREQSPRWATIFDPERIAAAIRAAGPSLLYGLQLWVSVCLANRPTPAQHRHIPTGR